MGDEGEANSGPATFAETIAQNLSSSTRRQYASRFAHFLEHLRRERDLAPDEIDLIDLDNITLDDYQLFFERIQVKRTSGPFSAPVDRSAQIQRHANRGGVQGSTGVLDEGAQQAHS